MRDDTNKSHQLAGQDRIDAAENLLLDALLSKFGVTKDEFLDFAQRKRDASGTTFPAAILRTPGLSSLEAIVKFLREDRELTYRDAAGLLSRDPKALAVTYTHARFKRPARFDQAALSDPLRIPFSVFSSGLPVLESICVFLRTSQSPAQIARTLGKDPSTVWTTLRRAGSRNAKGEHRPRLR